MIIFYIIINFVSNESNNKISEEYIISILTKYYSEIKQIFEFMKYDDLFIDEKILFMIPQFTIDKVLVKIKDNKIINIKFKDVIPSLRKEFPRNPKLVVVRNLIVLLNDFELEMNYKIKSEYNPDKPSASDVEIVGKPLISYTPEVISNYREMEEKFNLMIENGELNLTYIEPIINKILDTVLITIIENCNDN